ncbi:guanylate kinase [Metamycoplasma arthritidis]|uniref:Guanylate kinase n=1 Tax=Metamycoplasma arthritidis (strain 158L3-1) TaxID=243272 RepID=B3PN74_META1|nr:guanylate kinase [Metamycoplasma arthritidis]ACF07476.1 guanylate kinase [Metamycoplasma arthritidis 158L3-1]VEU78997.1 guanylate kinase [Metamycoplasma arthritidis]
MENKRKLIIFTGPSGVGKGTVEKPLFDDKELKLKLSVSITTRRPRDGEIDGVHYYFVSQETFDACLADNKLIEYSMHFDNYYGTLYSEIDRIIEQGKIPFLEIETNGATQIIDNYRKQGREEEIVSIFLMPPSFKELERRIIGRNTESNEVINKRLEKAKEEIGHSTMFEYVVINNDIDTTANEIKKIITKEFEYLLKSKKENTEGRKA